MRILSADPGLSGGLAFRDTDTGDIEVIDMPVQVLSVKRVRVKKGKKKGKMRDKERRAVCGRSVADFVERVQPDFAIVEQVASRPKQGVVSVFSFGEAYGSVVAAIEAMNVRVYRVQPAVWKRRAGLIGLPKSASLTLARKKWKQARGDLSLKKHEGRAEALLIGDYAEHANIAGHALH